MTRLLERLVFRHFFDTLAAAGGLAEWGLACWLAAPLGLDLPGVLHAAAVVGLVAVNRLAARRYEREPAAGPFAGRAGAMVVPCALGAIACVAALAAVAVAWAAAGATLGAFRAEAGMAAAAGAEPWLGGGFRLVATVAVGLTGALVAHGFTHGHRRLVVREHTVPLAGLGAPLRLVHVSDFHVGPLAERAALRAAIDRTNALDADVVCVTGDLVDSPAADLDAWMPELGRLAARHGVLAILGNHDRYAGSERIAAALVRHTGWRLLRDAVATVEVGGARLHIVGLDDRPRPEAAAGLVPALARVPHGAPVVLLAHQPHVFAEAAAAGVPLTLAGHTHGGQLALPGVPHVNVARLLGLHHDAGLFERDGARLHVSRGLGESGQRVRIGVPREITVLTLVPETRLDGRLRCGSRRSPGASSRPRRGWHRHTAS